MAGTAAAGTRRVIVRVGSRDAGRPAAPAAPVPAATWLCPTGRRRCRSSPCRRAGRRSTATVPHVIGAAPSCRARVLRATTRCSRARSRACAIVRRHERDLRPEPGDGSGAPRGTPAPRSRRPRRSSSRSRSPRSRAARGRRRAGSTLDRLLRQMLTYSDNAAANATERYFGGSTSGGSALVNAMMRSIGLVDTEMYGGYTLDSLGGAGAGSRRPDPAPGRQPAVLGLRQEDERVRPRQPPARRLARERRPGPAPRGSAGIHGRRRPLPPLPPRPRARPGQARSRGRSAARCPRAAQGRLDQRRPPRQRHRALARRRARRHRDDLPRGRCRGRRRTCSRAGSPRRRCAASAAEAGKEKGRPRAGAPCSQSRPRSARPQDGVRSREAIFGKPGSDN